MSLNRILRASSVYLLGNVASRAVGFLMIPVYAHSLRPDEYALIELLELCTQVVTISVGLQAFGLAMTRVYYRYEEGEKRLEVVSSAVIATAILGTLMALLAVAFSGPLSRVALGSAGHGSLTRAAFAAMAFTTVGEVVLAYHRMRDRAVFFVCYSLAQLIASLSLNIYFIKFAGLGVWGFVASKLITGLTGALYLSVGLFRETGWRLRWQPIRQMAVFGGPLIVAALSMFVIHFSDRFFLKQFAGLTDVGVYALAYKFAFLVTYLVGEPFGKVWYASMYSHAGNAGWQELFQRVARYLFFLLFLVGLGVSLFIDQVLPIVASPAFAAAAQLVPLLALGYVLRGVGDYFRSLLYLNMRSGQAGWITLLCAALNLILNYWLIGRFLAFGAVSATLLTWMAYAVCCWLATEREHKISVPLQSVATLALLAAVIYCGGTLGKGRLAGLQWAKDLLLVVAFVALVWLFRYFPAKDRQFISHQLVRLRTRAA